MQLVRLANDLVAIRIRFDVGGPGFERGGAGTIHVQDRDLARGTVYVANNGSDEIVEVDLEKWEIARRFKTEGAPYNLDITSDGRYLVASQKKSGTTGIFDLSTGEEIARIANNRKVTHGVVIAPDSRYAFVSVEGIGGEPGSVDVIDLQTMDRVATVEMGKQAGGIAFWKIDE